MSSSSRPDPGHHDVPDLLVERYLCDDLDESEREELISRLAQEPALAAHVAKRQEECAAFHRQYGFAAVKARIAGRPRRSRMSLTLWLLLAPAAAAALLVLHIQPQTSTERTRGGVKVSYAVKRGERVFLGDAAVRLRAGDEIRLTVEDPHGGYLYVLGLDESGTVSTYFDSSGSTLKPIGPGPFTLPGSLRLDNASTREALYVIYSAQRVAGSEMEAWIRGGAATGRTFPPWPESRPGRRFSVLELMKDKP